MTQWWTYRPSDFLMFSAASHARLLEQYNQHVWPLHVLMLAVGLLLVAEAAAPSSRAARWAPLALAGTWGWVGWSFLWSWFAEINAAARYLAFAFWIQAGLLVVFGRHAPPPAGQAQGAHSVGAAVVVAAVLLWPLTAPLTGRNWAQVEFFGLAPEPTALATLGWLMAAPPRGTRWLMVIPVVSMVLGLGVLWLLYGPDTASTG
jgi:hypothetical protein